MIGNLVTRIMHIVYPALVMVIVLTVWSSSTPPVGDVLSFFWNPTLSTYNTCNGNKIQNLSRSCSVRKMYEP